MMSTTEQRDAPETIAIPGTKMRLRFFCRRRDDARLQTYAYYLLETTEPVTTIEPLETEYGAALEWLEANRWGERRGLMVRTLAHRPARSYDLWRQFDETEWLISTVCTNHAWYVSKARPEGFVLHRPGGETWAPTLDAIAAMLRREGYNETTC